MSSFYKHSFFQGNAEKSDKGEHEEGILEREWQMLSFDDAQSLK